MAELNVRIVTPEREVFRGVATEIQVPGWGGEFDVLPDHDLLLSLLRGGLVTVRTSTSTHRFVVGRGFAEAGPSRVTLLTDSCLPEADVDKQAAQTALHEAESLLLEHAFGTPEWNAAIENREVAQASLAT